MSSFRTHLSLKTTFTCVVFTVTFVKHTVTEMLKIFKTLDGSDTLTDQKLNETYHSTNGAVQESMHVFIQNGLLAYTNDKKSISVFEMGFGTGLNALLTAVHQPKDKSIVYHSIEAFPVDIEILDQLNYNSLSDNNELYKSIIGLSYDVWKQLNAGFLLRKQKGSFLEATFTDNFFDIIYYDAFSPKIQPELWTHECMKKCYDMLLNGGILVTYCAQGQFKRTLKEVGFVVTELPGPPGKWQMTRAIKK